MKIELLLKVLKNVAKTKADGHYTIMAFTTGFKCMLGTPNLDIGNRQEIQDLTSFLSLEDAIEFTISEALREEK